MIDYEDVPYLLAALDAVLALHHPFPTVDGRMFCDHCNDEDGHFVVFPCPTFAAITDTLKET